MYDADSPWYAGTRRFVVGTISVIAAVALKYFGRDILIPVQPVLWAVTGMFAYVAYGTRLNVLIRLAFGIAAAACLFASFNLERVFGQTPVIDLAFVLAPVGGWLILWGIAVAVKK